MGTPAPLRQQPKQAIEFATKLVSFQPQYEAITETRENLKAELRKFGADTYKIIDIYGQLQGTVQVSEPEVATFKAKVLVVDQAKFEKLTTKQKAELLNLGVVAWEDKFTRDAKAKVETILVK